MGRRLQRGHHQSRELTLKCKCFCICPSGFNVQLEAKGSPSHQIGIAGFVMNRKREVLVVKEKCPCSCPGVWQLPTGYINRSEELFSGAVREVREETGVDSTFMEMVAFRHAHRVAFEQSDLLFVCMLKPLSSEITIDEKEIEAAKWMPVDEFVSQPFHKEDHMSRNVFHICKAKYDDCYNGFIAHQMHSKLDIKVSHLYYNNPEKVISEQENKKVPAQADHRRERNRSSGE